ncbi:hypothetical protein [Sansalvadorimonas verongulae]|uniref:hypothetical protein n=1 Tax=Sansalvadorimonas verongulae TaxID=2172824 RepID=UPI001E440F52|nr:hypothetical protein [Sansalvadorimonas verongulae]
MSKNLMLQCRRGARLLTVSALCAFFSVTAQAKWQNPADRYKDAYKEYTDATCPIRQDHIKNFVYFSRGRNQIRNHSLLTNSNFQGAQIMYSWAQLETSKDHYDFSIIKEDYEYLKAHGKKLFIQLQDATFNPNYKAVPKYLLSDEYNGGAVYQYVDGDNPKSKPEGWVARRWDKKVQKRFALLLAALGKEFDGKIEGINLQETAIGVSPKTEPTFTPESYVEGLKANMLAMKTAFPHSTTMQYANFMPGEWLPWEDKGYLKDIYSYGEKIGVGLGGPDLMFRKRSQLNHSLAMMHEHEYTAPLGIAVQDGNYIGQTNTTKVVANHKNIVPQLHAFAKNFLNVDYIFWVNQKPYFKTDVLSCMPAKSS